MVMMRALVAAMVSAALAASVRPASAQGDGGEDRPRGNGTVKIEVEKRGERRADAGGAPRPARTDPALFHTEVDVSWNGFAPSPELVDRLPEVEARDAAARREAAARIAARGPEGVRYLVTLLGRGDLFIEDAAEDALARLGADDTSRVAAGLFHPHFRVRSRTATVLGRMGERGRSAAPELERALLDHNSFVRESAARALGALRSPEEIVVRALVFALADPDSFVRFRAADGLAAVGPSAAPALEALCEVLAFDEDPT
ncbi:MAG: HEAT repeat domain-containing protein, partial [Planctomycetes bacterium]|nr:HEAT repeat domain-containing protein [Planctomycetota bacterium]